MKPPPLGFRQLKVIVCVANVGSYAAASAVLGRSKSAISKTVKEVEQAVGGPVFENTDGSRRPVATLNPLFDRARSIIDIFDDLASVYQKTHSRPRPVNMLPLFTMDASTNRLRKLALLDKTNSLEQTAQACGQSLSAVYKFFHELEEQLDMSLFARLPQGRYIPINFGEYLCRRVRLALSELRLAYDEILALSGSEPIKIVVGSLPSMRPVILPEAIVRMNALNVNWRIRIETSNYTQMASDMLRGDVDIIVGGTPMLDNSDELITRTLTIDKICILAHEKHPLIKAGNASAEALSDATWVLPLQGTPSRMTFENCLVQSGITVTRCIEAGDPTALRGLMLSDELLSVGTYFQSQYERTHGHLAIVPYDLERDDYPIGYTLRQSTQPSAILSQFIECLTAAIEGVEADVWI